MAVKKLQVAVSGLGRMGARHAKNYLERTPRADLVAACDPDPKALAWGKEHLEPFGVKLYSDFDEMLKQPGIEAVVVSGITTEHAPQAIKSIEAGKHTLCEKPLSTNLEISEKVVEVAKKNPHLKVLCGFSRRFDASYRTAAARTSSGSIGRPVIFRSQTCDLWRDDDFFIEYAKYSGGLFVDCQIHDLDLAFWFFGSDSVVKSVVASGTAACYPGLEKYGDVDNGVGIVEFWGGKIAYFYSCRIMMAGQTDQTEVIGTRGKLTINASPSLDLVESHEPGGIRRENAPTYWERFEPAFVRESNEFTEACLDDKELPFDIDGAVRALKLGSAMMESLQTGRKLYYDEQGKRVADEKATSHTSPRPHL